MDNLNLEIQTLDEQRQMRNLANAVRLSDSFSLLFVRCNQRPRQKEIIEELKGELAAYKIKVIFLENQIEHLLDELQERLGDEKPDAIFVYGLESSFPKADEAAESKFVVTLNHSRNSFKRVLDCPLVLFLPEYALSAIYHGATDFYSIRSGVYLFSAKAEETEQSILKFASRKFTESEGLLFEERQNRIKTIEHLLAEYQSLPDLQHNPEKENRLKNRLAELYYLSGKYERASEIYQEIIEYARKSNDLYLLCSGLNSLGLVYENQNKYDEAIKLYEEAKEIVKGTLGTKNIDYAGVLNNLAMSLEAKGRYNEAINLFKEVIEIYKEVVGTNHPKNATVLNNLASVYMSQGKYTEAISLIEEAIKISKETTGTNHPRYAEQLNNLGMVYFEQEKYQKALRLFEEGYRICIKILGRKHHYTIEILEYIKICRREIKQQASLIVPYKN